NQGDQIRGVGFLHDGSVDTVFRFLHATVFTGFSDDSQRADVEAFVHAFPSNLSPIVGQQVTLTSDNAAVAGPRVDLLLARAALSECELVAKVALGGQSRGFWRRLDGVFIPDRATDSTLSESAVRALATVVGQEVTYTCVPPGSGLRIGIDRDEDGCVDQSDPAPDDPAVS